MLTAVPDDVLRLIVGACSLRARLSLAATCRAMRDLVAAAPLPAVTLTCRQAPGAVRWMLSPRISDRVTVLVAKRCLYGACRWTARFDGLRDLALHFCRVRACMFDFLPQTVQRLDVHQLLPSPGMASQRLSLRRLPALRSLRLVLCAPAWNAAFLAKLPADVRELRVRGARALVIESRLPRRLEDLNLQASSMLLTCNRAPSGLRSLRLR